VKKIRTVRLGKRRCSGGGVSKSSRAIEKQIEGELELYKKYSEQLQENKELNKAVASMERSITTQSEVIESLQRTNRGLIEILELFQGGKKS
jgi:hypothetical protein